MQKCSACEMLLDLSEFYKSSKSSIGIKTQCKNCFRKKEKLKRLNNLEEQRRKDREKWAKRQARAVKKEKITIPALCLEEVKKRKAARGRVYDAVLRGDLVKPTTCERCNKETTSLHGHHEDYDFPLVVDWLCRRCHFDRHKEISLKCGVS